MGGARVLHPDAIVAVVQAALADQRRMNALVEYFHGMKWDDVMPAWRPTYGSGEYTEKHIDRTTFRAVIDAGLEGDEAA